MPHSVAGTRPHCNEVVEDVSRKGREDGDLSRGEARMGEENQEETQREILQNQLPWLESPTAA